MANVLLTFSTIVARLGVLCAALMPADAGAFDTEQVRPAAASHNEHKGNVIVFDNAYLDRRFGPTRVTETAEEGSGLSANPAKTGQRVGAFFAAEFVEIAPNSSLLKGVTRGTPARRAAALRMAESGRKAVQKKQYRKAIHYLEKALRVDAVPFVHFYLARAHYQLADYQRSLEFLEVAESAFAGHAQWLPELAALRRALSAPPVTTREPRRSISWTNDNR
jgi:tetratricopeptide (TPR) repeat protein